MIEKKCKVVVFDMDETLGHFYEFSIIIDILEKYYKKKINQSEFNIILDFFPEYIRPNIINILLFLKEKKKSNNCDKIIIYTNNNGPKEWANKIKNYLNYKVNYNLITQVIGAYKVDNIQIEKKRTTYEKTYPDLVNCANLQMNTSICFIDDLIHLKMYNNNTYYLNIKPYTVNLSKNIILDRLFLITNDMFFKQHYRFNNNFNKYFNKHFKNNTNINNVLHDNLYKNIKNFFIIN